jgi:hypothetical protein
MAAAAVDRSSTQIEARQAAQAYLNSRLTNGTSHKETNSGSRPFTIPEIDISPSFSSNLADRRAVAAQIHDACTNSGFFHITGHGVPESSRQAILELAKRFFKGLDREKKEALHVKNSKYFRGWEPADFTYVNPADWEGEGGKPETKEGFNWGYEEGNIACLCWSPLWRANPLMQDSIPRAEMVSTLSSTAARRTATSGLLRRIYLNSMKSSETIMDEL